MVVSLAAAVLLCWGACGLRRLVSAAVFSWSSPPWCAPPCLWVRRLPPSPTAPLGRRCRGRPWSVGRRLFGCPLRRGVFPSFPFMSAAAWPGFCFPVPGRRRPPPCFARCGLAAGVYGPFRVLPVRWVRRRSPAPWPPFVLLPRWLSAGGAFLFSPLCVVRPRRPFALFGAGALARRINGKICNMFCIMAAPLSAAPYKTHILPNAGAGAGGWIRDARKRDAAG